MEKKRFWLGMLALALALGMTVVGCYENNPDPRDCYVEIENGSAFDISYVALYEGNNNTSKISSSDPIGIKSGAKKKYEHKEDKDPKYIELTVKVESSDVKKSGSLTGLIAGGYAWSDHVSILLSGTSEETLKLSYK